MASVLVLAAFGLAWVVGLGFNPSDEGLVQSYGYRLLSGEVPHRDFLSPRPVGSSVLHLPTLLLPTGWMLTDRIIAAVEIAAATLAMTVLTWDRWPPRLPPGAVVLTVAAFALNVHTFPLMAWYTIDGMVLVAVGFCCLIAGDARATSRTVLVGLVLVGVAVTTKQSYFPAIPVALALVVHAEHRAGGRWIRRTVGPVVAVLAAPSLYAAVVASAGGMPAMFVQLTAVGPGFVTEPVVYLTHSAYAALFAATSAAVVISLVARHRLASDDGRRVATAAIASAAIVLATLGPSGLRMDIGWSVLSGLVAAVTVLATSLLERRVDRGGFLVLVIAWMASLSAGVPYPNLAGGSLLLYVLARIWSGSAVPRSRGRPRTAALALSLLAASSVAVVVAARAGQPYRDAPASDLTAPLAGVSGAFLGINTNPATREFVAEIRDCVDRYPARRVFIAPDGAGLYPALHLSPALPINWLWPPDYAGSEVWIVDAARDMTRDGDVLVLWQTVDAADLATIGRLQAAIPGVTRPFDHDAELGERIRSAIGGLQGACGSFLLAYLAPPSDSRTVP